MSEFSLTPRQQEATKLLGSKRHVLLVGGSRSGKTFCILRAIAVRALKAPGSSHAVFRYRFNHLRQSIIEDTWPKMMRLAFPGVNCPIDRSDWVAQFPGGSKTGRARVWFGGLDDKERTDKILGTEHATLYKNEASQIGYNAHLITLTRLAQSIEQCIGDKTGMLPLRDYVDLNPRTKAHWTYRVFVEKRDAKTRAPLPNPDDYAHLYVNPVDNRANLPAEYLHTLESLPSHMRKRFLEGVYAEETSNALWDADNLDRYRLFTLPEGVSLVRVAVALDPSATEEGNECGIMVGGLGDDGRGYLLADLSLQSRPKEWADVAVKAYRDHKADGIVAEANQGGQMIEDLLIAVDRTVPVRLVHASRGKITRAEPISALYEKGMISHVGAYPDLEDELTTYTTPIEGESAKPSPNRLDALVWLWAYLMPRQVANFAETSFGAPLVTSVEFPDAMRGEVVVPGDEGDEDDFDLSSATGDMHL